MVGYYPDAAGFGELGSNRDVALGLSTSPSQFRPARRCAHPARAGGGGAVGHRFVGAGLLSPICKMSANDPFET
jgi:hypothetical protein